MKLRLFIYVITFSVLLLGLSAFTFSYSFSGWDNYNVGLSPSECTVMIKPETTVDFYQNMFNTKGTGGNQWSVQTNYELLPNSPLHENWAQFNMAIDSSGNVYGAIELWNGSTLKDLLNIHTLTIDSVSGVQAGENWYIDPFTDSSGHTYSVTYYYYSLNKGLVSKTAYLGNYNGSTKLLTWDTEVVGENSGASNAVFSSGKGILYELPGGTAKTLSYVPTCTQSPQWYGTGENSNMLYQNPSINPSNQVNQNFQCCYYLTMTAGHGLTVSPSSGWYEQGTSVQISESGDCLVNGHYVFTGWSGSGSGSYTGGNNPATVTMNGNISETANSVHVTTCPSF